MAALLVVLLAACGADEGGPTADARPPIVLVIIDTLRADHLGCYGYELDTSPVIDAFARQAHLFEANATQCNATLSSITSIFTGLYPKTHLNYLPVPIQGQTASNQGIPSLAERLKALGYYTIAALSHPSWRQRHKGTALGRGWDRYRLMPSTVSAIARRGDAGRADRTNARIFEELERWQSEPGAGQLFLWAHYFDPHTPYDPPEPDLNRFLADHLGAAGLSEHEAALAPLEPIEARKNHINDIENAAVSAALRLANGRALYDGEIRYCDRQIGELFDRLRRDGLFDESLVIVMADHGENLDEPGLGHGRINFSHQRLFEGVVSTPLIVKLPGQRDGSRSPSLTQNIDVLPTILDLLGAPADPTVEGRSLRPLFEDPRSTVHERVFTESSDQLEKAVKESELKLIDPGGGRDPLLYLWRKDPDESRELYSRSPANVTERLLSAMTAFRPLSTLQIRLVPESAPYTVELELRLTEANIQNVVGVTPAKSPSSPSSLRWKGTVTDAPVEIVLLLDHANVFGHWQIARKTDVALQDRVYLGNTPLAASTAMPEWPLQGEAPQDARVRIRRLAEARSLEIEVEPLGQSAVQVELRYLDADMTPDLRALEVSDVQGFGELQHAMGSYFSRLRGTGSCRALLVTPQDVTTLRSLVRIDGTWPPPTTLAVNDSGVAHDAVDFWIVRDERLTKALASGPPAEAPPGSILIWTSASSEAAEIDTEHLDPELVEELRALGYIR